MTVSPGVGAPLGGGGALGRRCFVALLLPSAAQAHSELDRSDPLDGAVVPVGRSTLTLWFGEPVAAASSSFRLHTQDGSLVPTTTNGQRGTTVIEIETDPLERDTYQLDWRVFSLDDGHTTSGTLVFGVGLRPTAPTSHGSQSPHCSGPREMGGPDRPAGRHRCAVSGRPGPSRARRPAPSPSPHHRRPRRADLVLGGALTPFLRTYQETLGLRLWWDQTWLVLTDTPAGRLWLARQVALAVGLVAVLIWRWRPARPRVPATTAWSPSPWSPSARAGPATPRPSPSDSTLVGIAAAVHLLAAGVWAGGLGVLAWCLVPTLRRARGTRANLLGPVWRAYSPMAAVSTVVLLATGLLEAGHHLPGPGAVASTVYGAGVTVKAALMVVALGLAAVNTAAVHPGLAARARTSLPLAALRRLVDGSPRRFVATVTAEAVVLCLAVVLAAVVTSTPTAREDLDARRPTTVHAERADGLFVTFEEVPGGPSTGRLIVRIRSVVRPDPAPVTGVDVDLDGPGGRVLVALAETDPDRYEGTTAGPRAGRWTATVRVHRAGSGDTVTASSWTVEPAADRTYRLPGGLLGAGRAAARPARRDSARAPSAPARRPARLRWSTTFASTSRASTRSPSLV